MSFCGFFGGGSKTVIKILMWAVGVVVLLILLALAYGLWAEDRNVVTIQNNSSLVLAPGALIVGRARVDVDRLEAGQGRQYVIRAISDGTVIYTSSLGGQDVICRGGYVTNGISSRTEIEVSVTGTPFITFNYTDLALRDERVFGPKACEKAR